MSSTEAEFFAACLAAKKGAFLRDLLIVEFEFIQTSPTQMRIDNRGVVDLSFDPVIFVQAVT